MRYIENNRENTEENRISWLMRYNRVIIGLNNNPQPRLKGVLLTKKNEIENWFNEIHYTLELKNNEYKAVPNENFRTPSSLESES